MAEVTHIPAPSLPGGRRRLIVTGFMGTGKTVAGRRAATLLGIPFLDLDEIVQSRAGASIPEIFARGGEEEFRGLERQAVLDAARVSNAVIATGGGAVIDWESFGLLAEGSTVAVLTCEPGEIERRLASDGRARPLLNGSQRIRELLDSRSGAYARAGEPLDTTGHSVEDVAAALVEHHRRSGGAASTAEFSVASPQNPCAVIVGRGALDSFGDLLSRAVPGVSRTVVVADETVDGSAGNRVAASLEEAGLPCARLAIPAGEAAKNIETVRTLWDSFADLRIDRTDVVVAVGGGTALDAVGFAAATFGRGVPLANVPTTLLAMADASIGGKTGIDHAGVKNGVGAFHHPRLVVADPSTLATLDPRSVACGQAEVVKAALVASPAAVDILESHDGGDGSLLEWAIEQSLRIKAAYVAEDPFDTGPRHSLNLGHTFAHGIESASGYRIPHGEAVAMGLVAAARLGEGAGVTPPGTGERVSALLRGFSLPVRPPQELEPGAIAFAMGSDKKRRAGRSLFVVPAPGGVALLEGLDSEAAVQSLFLGVST